MPRYVPVVRSVNNLCLETLLEKERRQRKNVFGKPKMVERHYNILCEIHDCLSMISNYFFDLKTLFRDLSLRSLKEKKELSQKILEISPSLVGHFRFMSNTDLYWFNNKSEFQELYSFVKRRKPAKKQANKFEEYFRVSESNATKIQGIVYMKKADLLNFPSFNSPNTIDFFNGFYHSLKRNESAGEFLNKYLEN